MRKFCPLCGKTTDKFVGKVCEECASRKIPVVRQNPERIRVCKCGRVNISGKWKFEKTKKDALLKKESCTRCSRFSGGYWEAVIQLRGEKIEDIFTFIEERISDLSKTDELCFLLKTQKKKDGVDIYIGSKGSALTISTEARKIYNLALKKSYTLAGKRDGKTVYRTTLLLRKSVDGKL